MAETTTERPKVPAAGASPEEWDRYFLGCAEDDVRWCKARVAEIDADIEHHREMLKKYQAMRGEELGELDKAEAWLATVKGRALTRRPSPPAPLPEGEERQVC